MQNQSNPKSEIFSRYNQARTLIGSTPLDKGRLNRALGLAQRKCQESEYQTTSDRCNCPDSQYRPWFVCKHRLAIFLMGDEPHRTYWPGSSASRTE